MSERDVVLAWFEKAAEDLQGADVLLGAGLVNISCYHTQQAGEKALKAYLSQFMAEVPKTHDLGWLCRLCMEHDESFAEIHRISSSLTDFATIARYPGTSELTAQDAETAIEKAGRIFMFVQERISALDNNT